ncbi:polysaccharide biosynthesis tyrosine autokinase [Pseudomonas citronellolis]|uniref:polysaccharide biosynthesis tyrosine autokinase n=1 Tax=Pseudomonas citronellolis TaxID=53408 RepID=UPI0023E3E3CF|nr:polysaccharide biosynthesis tyrosine autokinase [Pseudomonas citronellolis]MDF3932261.1 polysaccharide biosynthesis tyrosine autokinase [Pseudomonas citronellolis]
MQQQPSTIVPSGDDEQIDLFALLGTLLDHKWFIASVTTGFLAVGALYALLATPVYRADATLQVEAKKPTIPGLSDMGDLFGGQSAAITEVQLISSRAVIGKVVDNLHLSLVTHPTRFPLIGNFIARRFDPERPGEVASAPPGLGRFGWGGEALEITQLEVPEPLLETGLTLIAGEQGAYSLFDEDGDPLVQGQVGQVLEQNGVKILVTTLRANPGTRFDVSRERRLTTIRRYQDLLKVAEAGKDSGIIDLSLDDPQPGHARRVLDEISRFYVRQNIERAAAEAASSLEFLRGQLPDVRQQLNKAEDALSNYQIHAGSADISQETKALLEQSVAVDGSLSELRLQQAEMDRKFTRNHPAYQALEAQIGELTAKQKSLARKVEGLPETQQELLRLSRDVEVGMALYSQLLNKTQELDVMRAGTVGNVRIIDSADVDVSKPVSPKTLLVLLIAPLLGLFSAVALVLLRKALNRGIETVEGIEHLGLPVYASVPFSVLQKAEEERRDKGRGRAEKAPPLLAVGYPTDLAVEALRSLRTSLHFAMLEASDNRLMLSGPSPLVGKTFVSANLAAVSAQAGQRVLLIDVDMRKGYLHKALGSDESNGLSDLLVRRCRFDDALRPVDDVPGLFFIPRGQTPPNPSELLMHPNFSAILEEASRRFDLVILDTPPVLAVTDAAIVAQQVGTSLIVTRFGLTPPREIELTQRRFAQNGIALKGAIFNGVELRASTYYSYGSHAYHSYE